MDVRHSCWKRLSLVVQLAIDIFEAFKFLNLKIKMIAMHCLYIDSSGDEGKPRKGQLWTHYVLLGLATTPEQSKQIEYDVAKVIEKYFRRFHCKPKELHFSDIHRSRPPFNLLADNKKMFVDEIFELIVAKECTLFAIVVDKERFFKKYKHPAPIDVLSLEMLTERFEYFLERIDDYGIMIYDRLERWTDLLKVFERFKEEGTTFKKLERIIDTLFFTPSETSACLQLADFCAYATRIHFDLLKSKKEQGRRFNQIKHKFDKYGIKLFP